MWTTTKHGMMSVTQKTSMRWNHEINKSIIMKMIHSSFMFSLLDHTFETDIVDIPPISSADEEQNSIYGLARIGTRTALNFAFAFLRRAWRSGWYC